MKAGTLGVIALMTFAVISNADTIAQWNFNDTTVTNSPAPSIGSGAALLVGGATASFAAGSSLDPDAPNSGWSTGSYPAQGTTNKQRGVQFNVSTVGYQNILITWDQRLSGTASKYTRLQYSTNGLDFVDSTVIAMSAANAFQPQTNNLAGVPGVEDNSNFAFRIVTEFESTAVGTANDQYVTASTSSYSTSGTIRIDMMTVSGDLIGGNTAPTISPISNQTTSEATPTAAIPFTIGDSQTPPENLVLSAESANPTLVDANRIVFGGTDVNRTVTVTPETEQAGTTTITITVTDEGGKFARASFDLTVLPAGGERSLVAQWNFNDPSVVNSPVPSAGIGKASLVGGTTAAFASGSTSDPLTPNNGWSTTSYPAQGAANKQGGVQFKVSTVGFKNITARWDQRLSATASKYARLQYSINGVDFIDFSLISISAASVFEAQTSSLDTVPEVNDNPNFAFRIVTEFESTAIGTANDQYLTTSTNAYSTAGTIRFDLLTISGELLPGGNSLPSISSLTNQTTHENIAIGPIAFTVGDRETAPDNLILSADSSNPLLVATNQIAFGGSGANRTITITPEAGQTGTATVKLTVTDEGGKFASTRFDLTVLPANGPPTVSEIPQQHTLVNTTTLPIPFLVGDVDSPASSLTVRAFSSNKNLVPTDNFNFDMDAGGSNRTVTITPAPDQLGLTVVTVLVSDGTNIVSSTFPLMVIPSAGVIFCDPFSYADGSVTTNSAFLWTTHNGTPGRMQVVSDQLQLSSLRNEDVNAALIGAPYPTNSGAILYARCSVNFTALPSKNGDYFAHFKDTGNAFRARIFTSTTNAAPGLFRLGVSNGAGGVDVLLTNELSLNTPYTVVLRYDVDASLTTLWLNPAAESDPSVSAADAAPPVSINAFAFRQSSGIGTLAIDNLRIGTSFADVVTPHQEVPMQIQRVGNDFQVSWPASFPNYGLQSSIQVNSPIWSAATSPRELMGGKYVVAITNVTASSYFRLYNGCP